MLTTPPADLSTKNKPDGSGQRSEGCLGNGGKAAVSLGSSCIYPKLAAQPMASVLLTGPLEPPTSSHAVAKAKIAGIALRKLQPPVCASHGWIKTKRLHRHRQCGSTQRRKPPLAQRDLRSHFLRSHLREG
jgi:hypothetical protein